MAPVATRLSPPRRSARRAARSQCKLRQSFKAPGAFITPRARREPRTTKNLPPKPSSVCELCWNGPIAAQYGLFHPPLHWQVDENSISGGYSYFISRYRCRQGAASGCVWCAFVRETLDVHEPVWYGGPVTGLVKITIGLYRDGMTEAQSLRMFLNGTWHWNHSMLVHTSADNPAAEYIVMRDPILDVGSPRALSTAKGHLEDCVHGHERCSRLSPPSDVRLPTRLVDCTDPNRPRLAETKDKHGKYLALSYVWGEAQPHQTTRDKVSIYGAGIDASLLPQTIRDAIYVTHQLGFQYLWVDSLCIVQDEDEDKLHEIGRMHLIYRRAHLTIVAARASRATEGFLQDRPLETWRGEVHSLPFLCPPRSPNSEEELVGEAHLFKNRLTFLELPTEAIHARGWCLQEFCMSPRVLIFGHHVFRFRCHSAMQNVGNSFYSQWCADCNDHQIRLPDVVLNPGLASLPERGSQEWFDVHNQWLEVVERYSGRSLGRSSDKLVACGAIAEAFHGVVRSDYLAGMWRDTLLCDLLWKSNGARRPTDYRGPSWSWISVDGFCTTGGCRAFSGSTSWITEGWAKVARCEVILKDMRNPFGEVTGGFLVLNACLIHCRVVGFTQRCEEHGDLIFVELLPAQRGQWPRVNKAVESGASSYCYGIDTSDDFPEPHLTIWQLVPIHGNAGLVVVPADPPKSGTHTESGKVYRRIGVFDLTNWENQNNDLEYALEHDKVPLVEIEII